MSKANPFAALFQGTSQEDGVSSKESSPVTEPSLNDILEEIFSFTLNEAHCNQKELLYLDDVSNAQNSKTLDMELLNHALFDRLFMCSEDNINIIHHLKKGFSNVHATEHRPILYLYQAYINLHDNKYLQSEYKLEVKEKIIQNVATSIIQPEIYPNQDIDAQMLDILKKGNSYFDTFFVEATRMVLSEENNEDTILHSFIASMNKKMTDEINKMSVVSLDYSIFNYFFVFTSNDQLANIFVDSNAAQRPHIGVDYSQTAIGALFNLSVLPKAPNGSYEHFSNPIDQAVNARIEGILWGTLDKLGSQIHLFLLTLLKCSSRIKSKTLSWLGNCLNANADRGKLWNSQAPPELNPANYTTVSDGFMLNLCAVILRLCRPFCGNFKDKKILKVDPTYAAVPNDKTESKGVHMSNLSNETCFIPVASSDDLEEAKLMANQYNFITECFFMAHKAFDLGYRVGVDRMMKMSHEIGRMERAYRDAVQQTGASNDIVSSLSDRLNVELVKFLSLKCALSEPILLKDLFDLVSSTAYWLTQVVVRNNFDDPNTYAPLEELKVTFPLSDKVPNTLKCIPEFLVENIVSYLVFLRRFSPKTFEEQGYEKLEPILTFVLIFMGSQHHMKNPHVRARLAEGLESLLPFHKDDMPQLNNLGGYQRQMLFTEHPYRLQIVENLMSVFVGIEMTGQSVEFEQKFNYRRPMYTVFEYLWEIQEHQECFKVLAQIAEKTMEAVNPPLFLRFANLLINDAIFLLDEALANMAKLKEMQHAHESGEWNSLSAQERTQNISYMHHVGNLARFDNILGKDTTTTLEKLTSKITIVFTHSTMVDRIAAMLNYFLLNLVGPNKKNFKVKGASKEFSFDPAGTVMDICKIYVNLKESDAFCLAVSQDGRSYSPNLFTWAEEVLVRIGGGSIIGELKEVAEKISEKAQEFKVSEEALSEAPEHFLDPIMSTLMTDPVILPSSKQIVDRNTIARHLLSDQTDPFNRSPLSMEQVIPNTELKEEIERWKQERQQK